MNNASKKYKLSLKKKMKKRVPKTETNNCLLPSVSNLKDECTLKQGRKLSKKLRKKSKTTSSITSQIIITKSSKSTHLLNSSSDEDSNFDSYSSYLANKNKSVLDTSKKQSGDAIVISSSSDSDNIESSDENLTSEETNGSKQKQCNVVEEEVEEEQHKNLQPNRSYFRGSKAIIDSVLIKTANVCILLIGTPGKLSFHGRFSISVVSGVVNILGYDLKPNVKFVDVFSPRGGSFLNLEFPKNEQFSASYINDSLKSLGISKSVIKSILQKTKPTYCILAIKPVQSDYMKFCEKFIAQKLLPTDHLKKNAPTDVEKYLKCRFLPNTQNSITIDMETQNLFNKLIADMGKSLKVMFCGGKGVGKSTLTRYFANKLLHFYPQVLYVDLDPGQSEFTIPGCVSVTLVEQPLLGPNYTHPTTPKRCIFVNNTDAGINPHHYLSCIELLREQCSSDFKNIPTVINFMGFTRFLGLPLVATAITIWEPATVIQIQSDFLKANYVTELSKIVVEREVTAFSKIPTVCSYYKLKVIKSLVPKGSQWKLQARQVRELLILSYFSKMCPSIGAHSLLFGPETPTYMILTSSVNLISCRQHCSNMLAVINASLVGICSTVKDEHFICHGWGIVRGVDKESDKLYISTPLNLDDLTFDSLVLGSVNLPPAVHMCTDELKGLIPYVSLGVADSLGRVPKKKYFPPKV